MVDIVDKKPIHAKPDPTEMLLAEAEVREKDPKQPHREQTAGETIFNRGVYTGIGFGVNEISAIYIADEFENRSGKKLFENISEWMAKNLKFKDTIEKGVTIPAKKNAANMLLWGSLLISGTLLVWPMKKLEDNKAYWVKKANHWMDKWHGNTKSEAEVAARDEEVEKALACEPKQTWPSMIVGRCIAVATALGLGKAIGTERSKKIMNWSEKTLAGSVQQNKSRWHGYMAVLPLETLSCATTSIALEIASKLFAKRGMTVRNPELCTQIVHEKEKATAAPPADSSGKPETSDTDVKKITAAIPEPATEKYNRLKSKSIIRKESHVDTVAASEINYSLAP